MGRKVIMLMTDSTRYDMLGCYGNAGMKTPNLDRLSEKGVRFERAYSCQPVCGPARAAIFTGQYPHSCGGMTNSYALSDNTKTLGQRLTNQGIHCAYIGKYHLDGGDYFGLGRCPEGWDEKYWFDMRCFLEQMSDEERMQSRKINVDHRKIKEEMTFGHQVADRAIDFLKEQGEEDFFLVASLDEPHGPFWCPQEFIDMYEDYEFPVSPNVYDTLEGKPDYQKVWAGDALFEERKDFKVKHPLFLGCNSYADYELGRILAAVEEYADDAMIIYTSDHGDALCSHRLSGKGPAVYDEIARVPLLIQNGTKNAGQVAKAPVSHISIAPTILEYFDVAVPKLLEGKSLMPVLENVKERVSEEVFVEFMRYECDHDGFGGFRPMRAVVSDRYKLAVHLLDSVDEFYDLEKDPAELSNEIFNEAYEKEIYELHDKLLNWMNETRDPLRGYDWERRPFRKNARTPSWGYTGYTRQRENEEYEPRQLDYATGLEMEEACRTKNPI